MPMPPSPARDDVVNEIAFMVHAMNKAATYDERMMWLDRHGWLMPRDAFTLCEMLDVKDEIIYELREEMNMAA